MTEVEMLYKELLELIEDNTYSMEEIKTHIYCLLKESINHPQNAVAVILDIEEERQENNRCPKCNGELETIHYKEYSECRGSDCYEVTYSQKCPDCSWDSDKD